LRNLTWRDRAVRKINGYLITNGMLLPVENEPTRALWMQAVNAHPVHSPALYCVHCYQ